MAQAARAGFLRHLAGRRAEAENDAVLYLDIVFVDALRGVHQRELSARDNDRALRLDERRAIRDRVRCDVDAFVRAAAEKRRAYDEFWLAGQRVRVLHRIEEVEAGVSPPTGDPDSSSTVM
jgi:hypothetical protein